MRRFYLLFQITQIQSGQLGWSHYVELIKIEEEHIRNFYLNECINSRWTSRELERIIKSHLYERLLVSKDIDNDYKENELEEEFLLVFMYIF